MKKKLYYEAPETEVFEVCFEGQALMASDPAKSFRLGGAGTYDDTTTNENGDY